MATRLDIYLVEKQYAKSRERAKRAILAGKVSVNGRRIEKPSYFVEEGQAIFMEQEPDVFVGQGGQKLSKALQTFPIELTNLVCMDLGASTGGFTDCMLQHGAAKVYAVDVGSGQLDEGLRTHPQVVNLEKTDARLLAIADYAAVSFVSCDVSFISVKLILPTIAALIAGKGQAVILIKPQFEAGRAHVGKGGIVKDKKVHAAVIADVIETVQKLNCGVGGLTYSPLCGGNIEYLLWINGKTKGCFVDKTVIQQVIHDAEEYFRTK